MKIQLPLENWADLLPFVPRRQLVALLFQLGDPQFASILQYCLNEEGHITLGHLRLLAPKEKVPILELCQMIGWNITPLMETTLPDEPIPKNVHGFKAITLSYLDSSVLDFLQKFHQHRKALLANVNLSIQLPLLLPLRIEKIQPILAQILPSFENNINSLQLFDYELLGYSRLLNNNYIHCSGNNDEFSELMTKMLTQTRILSISKFLRTPEWYCRWLYAPRMDGQPRMLSMYLEAQYAVDFINLIKYDFLMAKHPVTFFVQMRTDFSLELENICLENAETNENLVVKKYGAFLISRFPKAANSAKWIQANEQEILEFAYVRHDRTIYLDPQLALIPEKKHIQPTAPLLLLFILWICIGFNFDKLSIWALGFHTGLCAISGLYTCYWLKLTMFETLKLLAVLAVLTLICGNRLFIVSLLEESQRNRSMNN